MNIISTKVTPHLTLRQLKSEHMDKKQKRNMVLFLPWLYASKGAVDKYCDLYLSRNMDVLCANVELKHFLVPSTGRKVANEILDYLSRDNILVNANHYFIHAFSIGAYLYAIILLEMQKNKSTKYDGLRTKIVGQVFDSITVGGLDKMGTGIAQVSTNPIVQLILKGTASSYFAVTKPYTVDFYDETIYQFEERPIRCPVLFFYCHNDPMSDSNSIEKMVDLWKNTFKMDVSGKFWEKSIHAGHLKQHPEEYQKTLNSFMLKTGLITPGAKL